MKKLLLSLTVTGLLSTGIAQATEDRDQRSRHHNGCHELPSFNDVTNALKDVVADDANGFNLHMWATVVDRDGIVCSVSRTGGDRDDQWPGSRAISAQKANTANAFSLPGLSLSTANLYVAVQPGGSLFGLQHSNPVDTKNAYRGPSKKYGHKNDPLVGRKIGGVNVFGGGLALYDEYGEILGAVGVSGDSSCRDHIIAWKLRDALELDNVPAGVSLTGDDNMVQDLTYGFGHPSCGNGEEGPISDLPTSHPTGS
ncbi:MAG: heme-binding protein [Gammaproteobacteria bacterium]